MVTLQGQTENRMNGLFRTMKLTKAAHEMMEPDTVLFGRITYHIFENFWPKQATDPEVSKEAKVTAEELKKMTKIVFSRRLKEVAWENSKLINGNLIGEVKKLKQGDGPDIVIFGSGTIVQQLTDAGLMDEYLFVVTPVILGAGKSLFNDVKKLDLKLLEVRDFKSGSVMLHYQAKDKLSAGEKRKASSLQNVN